MPTPQNYRISMRRSAVALLLAYLREGTVDPVNFPTYPTTQNVWTFTHNDSLYYMSYLELGKVTRTKYFEQAPPLAPGISLEFANEQADVNQGLPQKYTIEINFRIRVPWEWVTEATVFELQRKVDSALQQAYGKIPIIDFTQTPPVNSGEFLENQSTERGSWVHDYPTELLSDYVMTCKFGFEVPASELGG